MISERVSRHLLSFPLTYVARYAFGIVYSSLLLATAVALLVHFKETTSTHCKVPNVFPTISAVMAGLTPESYIMCLGVGLASTPMLFEVLVYYCFFAQSMNSTPLRFANVLQAVVFVAENLFLFGIVNISSVNNYIFHRNAFIGFIVCSLCRMPLFLILFKLTRQPSSQTDKMSLSLRSVIAMTHIILFPISMYFFWRHNTYCEPYKVYSIYGALEYLVILTNIGFRAVNMVDFKGDYHIFISTSPPLKMQ